MEETYRESHGRRSLAVLVIVILMVAGVGYLGAVYLPSVEEAGFQRGFTDGYASGKWDGNLTGYNQGKQAGYADGLEDGNEAGAYTGFNRGYTAGKTDGYTQGYQTGATEGYNIHNPTLQEAMNFVAYNKVDQNEWSESYNCFNFVADFEAAAYAQGLRVGFVYILLKEGAHGIVVFDTSDHGLVYIEPQDDNTVTPQVGQPYWNRALYQPGYDDTILSYQTIW